jgi:ferrous iron transport protein B
MKEEVSAGKSSGGYNFALIGNMSVGKTSLFTRITGNGIKSINIPGSTVAVHSGRIRGEKGTVFDTPGLVSIFSENEDERVARQVLLSEKNGCGINGIILVADAKNLKRSIAIALQYSEFGLPMLLNINMMDEGVSRGIEIDIERLSTILGIEVTGTIAPEGMGIRELISRFDRFRPLGFSISYPASIDGFITSIENILGHSRIAARGLALLLLHRDRGARKYVEEKFGVVAARQCLRQVDHYYEEEPNHARHLLTEFYNTLAGRIAEEVQVIEPPSKSSLLMKFGDMCTAFSTGIPIAVLVLAAMYFFIGEFGATYLVDTLNSRVFEGTLFPLVSRFTDRLSSPFLRDMIMDPDFGILPTGVFLALGLVLPVIFCFYISFGILEDSGYLPRISILLDNVFQKMGLNGKGVIPLVMGFSCVTMALLTTRILNTEKEKNIASFLLYLCLPCAPLIAVMLIILDGMPVSATIAVFGLIAAQVFIAGYFANKILPGARTPLFLEIPPMRLPKPRAVLKMAVAKTYFFMLEALPIFILASLGVFLFERIGGLKLLEQTLGPMIHHVMGLPEKSVQVFIKTMIRRESGATELEHLRHIYTNLQLVVNLLVMTFVAPCINSFIILFKERGIKAGLTINVAVFIYAIVVGSMVNHLCLYFGITFS